MRILYIILGTQYLKQLFERKNQSGIGMAYTKGDLWKLRQYLEMIKIKQYEDTIDSIMPWDKAAVDA
jgi:hypothetical protein